VVFLFLPAAEESAAPEAGGAAVATDPENEYLVSVKFLCCFLLLSS